MPLQPKQRASLCDRENQELGQVLIEQVEGDLVSGRFMPGRHFASVERLFAEHVEAANEQLLSTVSELEVAICALGLHLVSPGRADLPAIHDVQIGAGGINFRTRSPGVDQPSSDQPGTTGLPRSAAPPELHTS